MVITYCEDETCTACVQKKGKNLGDQEDLMDERGLIWVLKNDEVWISGR